MGQYSFTVQSGGLEGLDEALEAFDEELTGKVLVSTLRGVAKDYKENALAHVPVGKRDHWIGSKAKGIRAKPGTLREKGLTIRRIKDSKFEAEVGVGLSRIGFYGYFLEKGTAKMAAKPWMRPAWDSRKDQLLDRLAELLGNRIDRAERKLAREARKNVRR